jgi:hypothetical protein
MKKTLLFLTAISFAVFFTSTANAKVADVCTPETVESVLTKALAENPGYLIKMLDGNSLMDFWSKLREDKLMLGTINIEKVYVIKSEHHEDSVYVFFIDSGCIVDVKLTSKDLIEKVLP